MKMLAIICRMDVRVLVTQAVEGFRVSVIAPGPPVESWLQVFPDKILCVIGLEKAGLLSPEDAADTLDDPFDEEYSMLVVHTEADIPTILAAGFHPHSPPD